jgi:phage gp29-like protein
VSEHTRLVAAPGVNERYQTRHGSALTPALVSSIFRSADAGHLYELADLLDEVRETDPHLHGVLAKRELVIAGAPWACRPTGDGLRARRVAEFCGMVLENLRGFSVVLAHLQSAVYHGRAACEVVWGWRNVGKFGRAFVPVEILPVHPRRLNYTAQDWRLHLYDASGGTPHSAWPGTPLDEYPAGKFLVHLPRTRGGYPTREGLGRPLVWMSVFKRQVIRDAMAMAELGGRFARIGRFNTGADGKLRATNEDVATLETALLDWSPGVPLILPDTTDVRIEKPLTGTTIHEPLVSLFDAQMSKCVLGGTLTTDAGRNGARSLGNTQRDDQLMIARGDAANVCETLGRDLLAPMTVYNWGDRAEVPTLALTVDPPADLDAHATRLATLVGAGLDVAQAEVRDVFGYRDPRPGEPLMRARRSAETAPADAPDGSPGTDHADPTRDAQDAAAEANETDAAGASAPATEESP